MEALKEGKQANSWNDDRLDELAQRVKDGFEKVDERFDRVEDRLDSRLGHLDNRLGKIENLIWGFGGTLVITVIVGMFVHSV